MAPWRAQAKASEAIVAATTMINAYSVVWLPASGPNRRDDTVRVDNDTVLEGMAVPFTRLGRQGTDRTGHRRDDGEQDEGW
jgi:hypothetical protein